MNYNTFNNEDTVSNKTKKNKMTNIYEIICNKIKKKYNELKEYRVLKINIFLYIIFTSIYIIMFYFDKKAFYYNKKINFVDMLYFATMMHTHVAIGDITPNADYAKIVVSIHIMTVFILTCMNIINDVNDDMNEINTRKSDRISNYLSTVESSLMDEV